MSLVSSTVNRLRRYRRIVVLWHRIRGTVADWFCENPAFRLLRRFSPKDARFGPPRGFFSLFDLVRLNQVSGRVLLTSQHVPPAGPDSLRQRCPFDPKQDAFQPWPVFWGHLRDVRLVGSSLVLLDGTKRVCLESAFHALASRDPGSRYLVLPAATRLEGRWTSVISRWSGGFYHWWLDALPRLAPLGEFPEDTRILIPADLSAYHWETVRWLGLSERVRPTREKHLRVESYYFSSLTAMTGCYNPHAVAYLRSTFLRHADSSYIGPRSFYVRRVNKTRGLLNGPEVEEYFAQQGWGIVDTEHLTMAQQIRLFSDAERICTAHGAALTNVLWCRPDCRVLELVPSTYLNGCFEGLAEAVGARYRFLICKADPGQRCRVSLQDLEKTLQEWR